MHCIGTIKQCGYFEIQTVTNAPLEINLGSGEWKLPISLINIIQLYNNAYINIFLFIQGSGGIAGSP